MADTSDSPTLEQRLRHEHDVTTRLLADLRTQRKEIDATVRQLVVDERTQRRLIAVLDRAKAKQNA